MSTWVAPATFTATNILTAAQLNATRDNLNFLKGALDLLTANTTADTGTGMSLTLIVAGAANQAVGVKVTGDAALRWKVSGGGTQDWGDGAAALDTNLYRNAASELATDDVFIIKRDAAGSATLQLTGTTAGNGMMFGGDTNLYRSAADTLRTDDGFWAAGGFVVKTKAGTPNDADLVAGMVATGAMILDTTNSRIYFRVGATWKSVVVA